MMEIANVADKHAMHGALSGSQPRSIVAASCMHLLQGIYLASGSVPWLMA